ncbi:hypothetical protein [Nocardia jiangxiensis]|uniref:Uncharacterized protein n=1 Tax=Nocardia jiangxiensis TaxID=282685 RepID=A0ABW6S070_9NOCA|nr:hypothetical protein [Nocardia jiangxiensis]
MTTEDALRAAGQTEALLVFLLTIKFGDLDQSVFRIIREATIPDLENWCRRTLTAVTIDGVFA